jgi:ABC-2 type transport system ATP-binding protein
MIRVENFHKSYRNVIAVDGLTFEAPAGTVVGLVGPNGAGKTTTFRVLAGIIPPTRGRLTVAGADIIKEPLVAKSRLAYIPDEPRLFDALTVWEHLEFVASTYTVHDFAAKAEPLLAEFDLIDKRDTLTQELSRGMRQKVAICCAYLHDPGVLLFDEPLTGLDPKAIRALKTSMRSRAAGGATIVVSSHLLTLVEDLCERLLILDKGRLLFSGSIGEARERFGQEGVASSLEDVFFRATGS